MNLLVKNKIPPTPSPAQKCYEIKVLNSFTLVIDLSTTINATVFQILHIRSTRLNRKIDRMFLQTFFDNRYFKVTLYIKGIRYEKQTTHTRYDIRAQKGWNICVHYITNNQIMYMHG